jgi:hypothetical protein
MFVSEGSGNWREIGHIISATAIGGTQSVVKTADETVNNSTVLQNDDQLLLPIGASQTWAFEMFIYFTKANAAPGFKFDFAIPATTAGRHMGSNVDERLDDALAAAVFASTDLTSDITLDFAGTTNPALIHIIGTVSTGDAGNLQFRWAQAVANASNTVVKAGSWMKATRLT